MNKGSSRCPDMEHHSFEPRYDTYVDPKFGGEISTIIKSIIRYDEVISNGEIEQIKKLITSTKYVRDICTFCGETRERVD